MSGYSEDERLRLQQLRALRRRWLRDQELSEREPVLPRRQLGPVAAFWERFLQPGGLWRHQVFKAFQTGSFVFLQVLVPSWIILYCLKYHIMKVPHGVVMSNPRIFPGDRILETGEIIPPLKEEPGARAGRAMASSGVKTFLQAKEIREAVDRALGTRAQPTAPRDLLSLGAPQALTKPAAVSLLGAEFPGSTPPPNCGALKRTFGCTNLLLLSLADHEDHADGETPPGPLRSTPCPEDNTEPTAPPEHSSPPLACPAEEDSTWRAASRSSARLM